MAETNGKAAVQPKPAEAAGPPVPPPRSAGFSITKPSRDNWLKMLIYGPYGSGKTFLAATAKDVKRMRDVLFIDAESGQMTLADFTEDIDIIDIKSFHAAARVHDFLRLHCRLRDEGSTDKLKKLEAQLRGCPESEIKKPKQYRTVVIDSLSEVQKYAFYQIQSINIDTDAIDNEPADVGIQDYGKLSEMTRLLVRSFRNLPMNVIFVCADGEKEDERKQVIHQPLLVGKAVAEVQGIVDVVGFLFAQASSEPGTPMSRRLFLQPGTKWRAKDRYHNKVVSHIDDPSMAKFLET